jgi:energy-coupling factor transport system substrate-specific component
MMHATLITNRFRWRVVDIVTAAVIGVTAGFLFFAWNLVYAPVTAPFEALLPGLQALLYGVWLVAGVLGALVIRKPGAAVFTSIVAASVSALLGASWGLLTVQSGLIQGLGAELIFLAFLYKKWNLPVAMVAGVLSGFAMAMNDWLLWYPGADTSFIVIYTISAMISGAVIAGWGSWALMRGLAKTGALVRFESGREVTGAV